MRALVGMQPFPQPLQLRMDGQKLPDFVSRRLVCRTDHNANHHEFPADIDPGTTFDHGFNHLSSLLP